MIEPDRVMNCASRTENAPGTFLNSGLRNSEKLGPL
jgi:hypothetical protein